MDDAVDDFNIQFAIAAVAALDKTGVVVRSKFNSGNRRNAPCIAYSAVNTSVNDVGCVRDFLHRNDKVASREGSARLSFDKNIQLLVCRRLVPFITHCADIRNSGANLLRQGRNIFLILGHSIVETSDTAFQFVDCGNDVFFGGFKSAVRFVLLLVEFVSHLHDFRGDGVHLCLQYFCCGGVCRFIRVKVRRRKDVVLHGLSSENGGCSRVLRDDRKRNRILVFGLPCNGKTIICQRNLSAVQIPRRGGFCRVVVESVVCRNSGYSLR